MTQEQYTTMVLKADEGMALTQAGDVSIRDRIITGTVYLAANDSPDNWKEITEAEGAEIAAAQAAERKGAMERRSAGHEE